MFIFIFSFLVEVEAEVADRTNRRSVGVSVCDCVALVKHAVLCCTALQIWAAELPFLAVDAQSGKNWDVTYVTVAQQTCKVLRVSK